MGNSGRHFSKSSIGVRFLAGRARVGLSPNKVAQRQENQPRRADAQRGLESGNPPRGNQHGEQRDDAQNRAPISRWRDARKRLSFARKFATKCNVRDQNHQPDEWPAKECRANHEKEGLRFLERVSQNHRGGHAQTGSEHRSNRHALLAQSSE